MTNSAVTVFWFVENAYCRHVLYLALQVAPSGETRLHERLQRVIPNRPRRRRTGSLDGRCVVLRRQVSHAMPVARILKRGVHFWCQLTEGSVCNPNVSSLVWGCCKPPSGIRGRAPEANAFWQQSIENWLKIRSLASKKVGGTSPMASPSS